jgi:hypothetical protein
MYEFIVCYFYVFWNCIIIIIIFMSDEFDV